MRSWKAVLVVLGVLVVGPALLLAQTTHNTGAVAGTVADPTGAVIPGAEVELTNSETNVSLTRSTNATGKYTFSNVTPGRYRLTVSSVGFRTANVSSFRVFVTKVSTVDVALEVGQVTETVEVVAGAEVQLQTSDATVGNVYEIERLTNLPTLNRNANELLTLQPGTIPNAGGGDFGNNGGAVAGARSDQTTITLNGVDVTDTNVGGVGTDRTIDGILPFTPVEAIEEFRVNIINSGAQFNRSGGGQIAMIGRGGGNQFHGGAYWYHQNDNLNANSWTNNTNDIDEAEAKDNRYGFRVGGPIRREQTFFHFNWEAREFPRAFNVVRLVPSPTMAQGILTFNDANGNPIQYDLAASTLCGPANTDPCDPRGIGISPTIASFFSQYPAGNDPNASAFGGNADALNVFGFRGTATAPLEEDFAALKIDHVINNDWRVSASYYWARRLSTSGDDGANRQQLSILGGTPEFTGVSGDRGQVMSASLSGQFNPNLLATFTFGFMRNQAASARQSPSGTATSLALPGTSSVDGLVALNLDGSSFDNFLSEPIDVSVQRARSQATDQDIFQYKGDGTWIRGSHTVQFGGSLRFMPFLHIRDDKVVGNLASLVADVLGGNNIAIPATSRPPTCGGALVTNCIQAADVARWDALYGIVLGLTDQSGIMRVRDGDLNLLPAGVPITNDTESFFYELYAQDTWKITSAFSLIYGLAYQVQTPPSEVLDRQTLTVDANSPNQVFDIGLYLEQRRTAALAGNIFNPTLGYQPIATSGRSDIYGTDWDNFAPRIAAAWNPSYSSGLLGKLFGDRKTVFRGGYSLVYDRLNNVATVLIPSLGVGFSQSLSIPTPACDATGAGGPNCNAASADQTASTFRIGVDGSVAVPSTPTTLTGPIVPPVGQFSELLSFYFDPDNDLGENHTLDFTIQRELPGDMIMELGYLGRFGRNLNQGVDLNSVPYFTVDSASGQTFAEAFDAVADQVRAGAAVTPQPWFENQWPGLSGVLGGANSTEALASAFGSFFLNGNVSTLVFVMDSSIGPGLGLPSLNNTQVTGLWGRTNGGRSNYHAFFTTLRKSFSHGLAFDLNYTLAKSLDQAGTVQNSANNFRTSYFPDVDYGPSRFDRTHVFNGAWSYDLPIRQSQAGALGRLIGGWNVSGVFTAASGLPACVNQGASDAFGGGLVFTSFVCAVPTVDVNTIGTSAHSGIIGGTSADGTSVGSNGDPANGGTGLNMFANPAAVFDSVRRVRISQDGRHGISNPFRQLGFWNVDLTLRKRTLIKETVAVEFSFDFFNILNRVNFADPSRSLTNPASFGVIDTQATPPDRQTGSRWIQFGFRVEF